MVERDNLDELKQRIAQENYIRQKWRAPFLERNISKFIRRNEQIIEARKTRRNGDRMEIDERDGNQGKASKNMDDIISQMKDLTINLRDEQPALIIALMSMSRESATDNTTSKGQCTEINCICKIEIKAGWPGRHASAHPLRQQTSYATVYVRQKPCALRAYTSGIIEFDDVEFQTSLSSLTVFKDGKAMIPNDLDAIISILPENVRQLWPPTSSFPQAMEEEPSIRIQLHHLLPGIGEDGHFEQTYRQVSGVYGGSELPGWAYDYKCAWSGKMKTHTRKVKVRDEPAVLAQSPPMFLYTMQNATQEFPLPSRSELFRVSGHVCPICGCKSFTQFNLFKFHLMQFHEGLQMKFRVVGDNQTMVEFSLQQSDGTNVSMVDSERSSRLFNKHFDDHSSKVEDVKKKGRSFKFADDQQLYFCKPNVPFSLSDMVRWHRANYQVQYPYVKYVPPSPKIGLRNGHVNREIVSPPPSPSDTLDDNDATEEEIPSHPFEILDDDEEEDIPIRRVFETETIPETPLVIPVSRFPVLSERPSPQITGTAGSQHLRNPTPKSRSQSIPETPDNRVPEKRGVASKHAAWNVIRIDDSDDENAAAGNNEDVRPPQHRPPHIKPDPDGPIGIDKWILGQPLDSASTANYITNSADQLLSKINAFVTRPDHDKDRARDVQAEHVAMPQVEIVNRASPARVSDRVASEQPAPQEQVDIPIPRPVEVVHSKIAVPIESPKDMPVDEEPPILENELDLPSQVQNEGGHKRRTWMVPTRTDGHQWYRSLNRRPLEPGEMVDDSDEEPDESWLELKHSQIINDNTKITVKDKNFMNLWNSYLKQRRHITHKQIRVALVDFVQEYKERLVNDKQTEAFWRLLVFFLRRSVIDAKVFEKCMNTLNHSDERTMSLTASLNNMAVSHLQQGPHDVDKGLRNISLPADAVERKSLIKTYCSCNGPWKTMRMRCCTSKDCKIKWYHETCVAGSASKRLDWKCGICWPEQQIHSARPGSPTGVNSARQATIASSSSSDTTLTKFTSSSVHGTSSLATFGAAQPSRTTASAQSLSSTSSSATRPQSSSSSSFSKNSKSTSLQKTKTTSTNREKDGLAQQTFAETSRGVPSEINAKNRQNSTSTAPGIARSNSSMTSSSATSSGIARSDTSSTISSSTIRKAKPTAISRPTLLNTSTNSSNNTNANTSRPAASASASSSSTAPSRALPGDASIASLIDEIERPSNSARSGNTTHDPWFFEDEPEPVHPYARQ